MKRLWNRLMRAIGRREPVDPERCKEYTEWSDFDCRFTLGIVERKGQYGEQVRYLAHEKFADRRKFALGGLNFHQWETYLRDQIRPALVEELSLLPFEHDVPQLSKIIKEALGEAKK